jgi:orotate phosphoribosyltransferase
MILTRQRYLFEGVDSGKLFGENIRSMTQNEVLEHFKHTNALLEGHFILSSGRHSSAYLQCALALQLPADALRFGLAIADKCAGVKIDSVVSPAIGGLVIGFAVAQALGVRFIWTERQEGVMTLRRGFTVGEGERFLVVEDVITTGGSTRECITAIENLGAKVVAGASIIDRSGGAADIGVPRVALATLEVESFAPEDCPLCAGGNVAVKPGSRTTPAT